METKLPAIILETKIVPHSVELDFEDALSHFRGSVVIFERRFICECCGGLGSEVVAIWDFDFDRSCDFFLPYGTYANGRMIDLGVEAYNQLQDSGLGVQ